MAIMIIINVKFFIIILMDWLLLKGKQLYLSTLKQNSLMLSCSGIPMAMMWPRYSVQSLPMSLQCGYRSKEGQRKIDQSIKKKNLSLEEVDELITVIIILSCECLGLMLVGK